MKPPELSSARDLLNSLIPAALATLVAMLLVLSSAVLAPDQAHAAGHLNVITIEGSINPASADYIMEAIAISEADGAAAARTQAVHKPLTVQAARQGRLPQKKSVHRGLGWPHPQKAAP